MDDIRDGGDDLGVEPGVSAAEEAAGALSVLDRVKARREERIADETLTLDIPTWGGELRAKYKVVPRPDLEKMVRKIRARQSGNGQGGNEADLDFLIQACVGVVAYDTESGEQEEVTNGYNKQLSDLLGVEAPAARDVLLYLFKGNGIAIAAHAMKVARWMQDTSKDPEQDPQ